MDYRDNWDKSKERFEAFWNREIIDRCCVSIKSRKDGSSFVPAPFPENTDDKIKYWTDGEWVLKRSKAFFENTYFGGDAFPQVFSHFGTACHTGFFKNARYQFEKTIWFFPFINDWKKDVMEFDPESFFYSKHIELAKYLVNESKGSFFVSMPDLNGNADALANLRGSENLLMDMVLEPDRVHKALHLGVPAR